MHWNALLQEVLNKKTKQKKLSYQKKSCTQATPKKLNKYFLDRQNQSVYFTCREAEVMVQLLRGKTLNAAAAILNLSPRTIEFYVKNMKTKLACRTKSELIGKVFASDFIKSVDFITGLLDE